MTRPAFAKLPSAWARTITGVDSSLKVAGYVAVKDEKDERVYTKSGLGLLQWREHKSGATAALLILFALAVISNRAQRRNGLRKDDTVGATYENIQDMVPLSRKLIADGLQLLLMVDAISVVRDGRRNIYTLKGIEQPGKWCQLPQQHLHNGYSYLQRLKFFVEQIRNRTSLHALKLYMLLLAYRDSHTNFTVIGYDKIMLYTGMRREEVSIAIQLLISSNLCRLLADDEVPRDREDRMHNRYAICGLAAT